MKKSVYVLTTIDLEEEFKIMQKDEAAKYRDFYNNRYPLNTPYMVVECELDEFGEPDMSNFDVID